MFGKRVLPRWRNNGREKGRWRERKGHLIRSRLKSCISILRKSQRFHEKEVEVEIEIEVVLVEKKREISSIKVHLGKREQKRRGS